MLQLYSEEKPNRDKKRLETVDGGVVSTTRRQVFKC